MDHGGLFTQSLLQINYGVQWFDVIDSPLGQLMLTSRDGALTELRFAPFNPEPEWRQDSSQLAEAATELTEYFDGKRRSFQLQLAPSGTPYQELVWRELRKIPYGQTVSYGEVARRIGQPGGSQAIGGASHNNPLPILIPCHRVIAANGDLGGYALGVEVKRRLLELEGAIPQSLF